MDERGYNHVEMAIQDINGAYGKMSVSNLSRLIRRDEKMGGHPDLR